MATIFSSSTECMSIYIQEDADPFRVLNLGLQVVAAGGTVVMDPRKAMAIIIVDRNTTLGRCLIATYSVCPDRDIIPVAVVDYKWLDACVQQGRVIGECANGGFCGGFYIPRDEIVAETCIESIQAATASLDTSPEVVPSPHQHMMTLSPSPDVIDMTDMDPPTVVDLTEDLELLNDDNEEEPFEIQDSEEPADTVTVTMGSQPIVQHTPAPSILDTMSLDASLDAAPSPHQSMMILGPSSDLIYVIDVDPPIAADITNDLELLNDDEEGPFESEELDTTFTITADSRPVVQHIPAPSIPHTVALNASPGPGSSAHQPLMILSPSPNVIEMTDLDPPTAIDLTDDLELLNDEEEEPSEIPDSEEPASASTVTVTAGVQPVVQHTPSLDMPLWILKWAVGLAAVSQSLAREDHNSFTEDDIYTLITFLVGQPQTEEPGLPSIEEFWNMMDKAHSRESWRELYSKNFTEFRQAIQDIRGRQDQPSDEFPALAVATEPYDAALGSQIRTEFQEREGSIEAERPGRADHALASCLTPTRPEISTDMFTKIDESGNLQKSWSSIGITTDSIVSEFAHSPAISSHRVIDAVAVPPWVADDRTNNLEILGGNDREPPETPSGEESTDAVILAESSLSVVAPAALLQQSYGTHPLASSSTPNDSGNDLDMGANAHQTVRESSPVITDSIVPELAHPPIIPSHFTLEMATMTPPRMDDSTNDLELWSKDDGKPLKASGAVESDSIVAVPTRSPSVVVSSTFPQPSGDVHTLALNHSENDIDMETNAYQAAEGSSPTAISVITNDIASGLEHPQIITSHYTTDTAATRMDVQINDLELLDEGGWGALETPIGEESTDAIIPSTSPSSAMVSSAFPQKHCDTHILASNSASNSTGNDIGMGIYADQTDEEPSSTTSVIIDDISSKFTRPREISSHFTTDAVAATRESVGDRANDRELSDEAVGGPPKGPSGEESAVILVTRPTSIVAPVAFPQQNYDNYSLAEKSTSTHSEDDADMPTDTRQATRESSSVTNAITENIAFGRAHSPTIASHCTAAAAAVASTILPAIDGRTNDTEVLDGNNGRRLETSSGENSARTVPPAASSPSVVVSSTFAIQNYRTHPLAESSTSNHLENDTGKGTSTHQTAESSSVISSVADRIASELAAKAMKHGGQRAPYQRNEIMQLISYLVDHPREYGELRSNKLESSFAKGKFWQTLSDKTGGKRLAMSLSNYFLRHQSKLVDAVDAQILLITGQALPAVENHLPKYVAKIPHEVPFSEGEAFDRSETSDGSGNEDEPGSSASVRDDGGVRGVGILSTQQTNVTRGADRDDKNDDDESEGSLYMPEPSVEMHRRRARHNRKSLPLHQQGIRRLPFTPAEIGLLVEFLADHPDMYHRVRGTITVSVNRSKPWIEFGEGAGRARPWGSWKRYHCSNHVVLEAAADKLLQERKTSVTHTATNDKMAQSSKSRGIESASGSTHPIKEKTAVERLMIVAASLPPPPPLVASGTPRNATGSQRLHRPVGFISYFTTQPSIANDQSTPVPNLDSLHVSFSTPLRSSLVTPEIEMEASKSRVQFDPTTAKPVTLPPVVRQEEIYKPKTPSSVSSMLPKRPAEDFIGPSSQELASATSLVVRPPIKRIRLVLRPSIPASEDPPSSPSLVDNNTTKL
ncbi:hypothetical protein FRB93_007768 [Tulasnella sp. JGI-2019a]|nr:hypothetical protein FRB93_007768 [Tulasnella sp. JGI-2019a]